MAGRKSREGVRVGEEGLFISRELQVLCRRQRNTQLFSHRAGNQYKDEFSRNSFTCGRDGHVRRRQTGSYLTLHQLTEVRRGDARGRETKARLTFTTSIFMSRKDHPLLRSLGNTRPAAIYTNYPLITTAGLLKVIIHEGRNRGFHLHPQRLSELVRSRR